MFIAPLFIRPPSENNPNASTGEWINNCGMPIRWDYDTAMKDNKVLNATTFNESQNTYGE